ncbi:transglutaminase-like cysteine peptidase [Moritella sp.]|uniref:transglutaminase-like cysteine peptidase n=1 Tax=Moritella sp. TaxID=78556 RepID=UPI001D79027F|nr:transglutaminase-like cysteine peptidase [Moritella sp.]MCJ8348594.1 transglutaminase-like cysteine peptidase [Moritella sp.]NQZ42568.1 transglutaminase-like cysteine peptidase [Moritella sp.]
MLLMIFGLPAKSVSKLNNQKIVAALNDNYGQRAAQRGRAWLAIMANSGGASTVDKLAKINRFFNQLQFIDDSKLWGVENYWATPIEFIGVNGGDCEDFAIAKYFSLLELGIADEKMRITMVKSLTLNQYHMVVAYYPTPGAVPLILDNIDGEIKPADQRNDLLPVYSFNGKQLWLNKEKGQGVLAGKSQRLKRWSNLNQRMGLSNLKQAKLSLE